MIATPTLNISALPTAAHETHPTPQWVVRMRPGPAALTGVFWMVSPDHCVCSRQSLGWVYSGNRCREARSGPNLGFKCLLLSITTGWPNDGVPVVAAAYEKLRETTPPQRAKPDNRRFVSVADWRIQSGPTRNEGRSEAMVVSFGQHGRLLAEQRRRRATMRGLRRSRMQDGKS